MKHYVNGPEAFLHTLLVEYKDAEKRFDEICHRIGHLITPPVRAAVFILEIRDADFKLGGLHVQIRPERQAALQRRSFYLPKTLILGIPNLRNNEPIYQSHNRRLRGYFY
jgi:hypothetical protein